MSSCVMIGHLNKQTNRDNNFIHILSKPAVKGCDWSKCWLETLS